MKLCSLLVCLFLSLLSSPAVAQTSPTRDPQGVLILQESVAAMGGATAIASVKDFVGTGTITYFWGSGPIEAPATAKGLGLTAFRLDSQLPQGDRSWVVTESGGSLTSPSGKTTPIPWGDAVGLLSATWPAPVVLAALSDTSYQVSDKGQVTFDGHPAYDVRIEEVFSQSADPKGAFSALTARDLLIDASSHLVLGIRDTAHPTNLRGHSYPHELIFSNYRNVDGVSVPFSVTETLLGQKTSTLTLGSISFNTGLTTADFTL